ncbi:MAG: carbohydrate ABC transporter permease [Clostridia bacterium]|nr:carbohydrate ABC transporter permease [Clostridia bacterium]
MIKSRSTRVGDWVIAIICFVLILVCLLPMVHVLASSLSSAENLVRNDVFLIPKGVNLEAYVHVLTTEKYVWSLAWTAILTVVCTLLSITLTICASYPLIYTNLKGGRFISLFMILTMYFSAGTIPGYLLLKSLKMLDTPFALIFPNCISVFNVIIMRSFFFGVPDSLREAAEIDGAGPIRVLIRVYLPLSLPVIATLSLFYAVGRWNGFSDAKMYLSDTASRYWPIQMLLYNLLQNSTQSVEQASQESFFDNGVSQTIQMATVMFATVPILLVYPWLQRYFVTGVTIGAVKG